MLDDRRVLIVAGFDKDDTLAAVNALTKPTPLVTRLQRDFQQDGLAELVVRIRPDGEAEIYEFSADPSPQ